MTFLRFFELLTTGFVSLVFLFAETIIYKKMLLNDYYVDMDRYLNSRRCALPFLQLLSHYDTRCNVHWRSWWKLTLICPVITRTGAFSRKGQTTQPVLSYSVIVR